MNEPRDVPGDIAFSTFLDELKNNLRAVREDQNALRLTLRRSCEISRSKTGASLLPRPAASARK